MYICQVRRSTLRKTPESLWLNKIKLLFLSPPHLHSCDCPAWAGGVGMGLCSTSSFGGISRQYACCLLCPELPWGRLCPTCQQPQSVCGWCRRSSSQGKKWSRSLLPTLDRAQATALVPCKGDGKMYSGNSCWVRESTAALVLCFSKWLAAHPHHS